MVTAGLDIRHKRDEVFFYDCPRAEKQFEVRECKRSEWAKFRKYHYLNTDLPSAAQCYGLYDGENIIGFLGVLHQPHARNKKIKRVCRLVILPDYQGIGLGTKLLNVIAERYTKLGFDFSIVTSAKNFIYALKKSDKWLLQAYCISSKHGKIDGNRASLRMNCKTARFMYKR